MTEECSTQPLKISCVTAYFHIPALWLNKEPSNDNEIYEIISEKTLNCGIRVKARRDGLFIFDFSNWKPASISPDAPDKEIEEVVRKRISVMNVHLACLNTSTSFVGNMAMPIKQIITATDYILLPNFESNQIIIDTLPIWSPIIVYLQTYMSSSKISKTRNLILSCEIVERSYELLDDLLIHGSEETLIIAILLYNAVKHYTDHDFSTSLILSWAAIEKMLNESWMKYIENNRTINDQTFINSERKYKLGSRDFTASIISEILSLTGQITTDIYRDIEKVRKVRNAWMHELKEIKDNEASLAIRLAQSIFDQVHAVKLNLCISLGIHW